MPQSPTGDEPDSQETAEVDRSSFSDALPSGSWRPLPRQLGAGRFEILGLLGEGGMGEVFRARDVRLDREVALKRLKARVLDERARSRLAREAQAMALLSHPNVIEVYDVVLDDDLVVMELVSGPTLAQWLQAGPRGWREALPIFVQAGQGLAAAHDAGLVHRDFKPSNVILGDDGRVRVMDFGLARPPGASVDDARSAETPEIASSSSSLPGGLRDEALTATGMVVGTPAYMAPEQIQGLPADGRTDQYAFCVVMWQALCGKRPFDGTYVQLGRAKLRGPPPWPKHVPVPRRLVAAIRRGMSPDASARWSSMPQLLAELEAVARVTPPRRGLALGAGGLMVAGATAMVLSWSTHAPGCEDADALRHTLWDDERRAAVEAALLGSETTYAAETWDRVGPALDAYASRWADARHAACEASLTHGADERARPPAEVSLAPPADDALLDARRRCLEGRRRSFEALVGALSQTTATPSTPAPAAPEPAPTSTSEAFAAVEHLPSVAACSDPAHLRSELPPPDDPAVGDRVTALRERLARADALRDVARCGDAAAELAAIAPEIHALAHAPSTVELRLAEGRVAECAGDYAAAEAALREAYFLASELGHAEVAAEAALQLVTVVGVSQERHAEGLQWSEHAQAELARRGDPSRAAAWHESLGSLLHAAGRYDEAIAAYERGLATLPVEGPETTMQAVLLDNLGSALRVLGRFDDARVRHEQALAITERVLGPDHPDVTGHLVNLANVYNDLGEPAQAEALQRRALARVERDRGPMHPATMHVAGNLALSLSLQGRAAEAIALHERCVAGLEAGLGPDHPDVAMVLNNLGIDQLGIGDVEGATRSHRRALEIREQALGPEHMLTASSLSNLADAELAAGHARAARQGYARALPVFEEALGPDAVAVSYPLVGMGRALLAEGDPAAAVPLLERGLSLREHGGMPPELFEARFELARARWDAGQDRERALALVRDALAGAADVPGGEAERERAAAWLRERER